METINIWWEGPFAPNNIELVGVPTFLRKQMDGLDNESELDNALSLYLVYNLIGVEWELLYVGATTTNFYKTDAEKWDLGSGQDIGTIMIYQGTLYDAEHISLKDKEEKLKKAEALLINVLEGSFTPSHIKNVSKDMLFLKNLNIEKRLYPLLKAKYYLEDGLISIVDSVIDKKVREQNNEGEEKMIDFTKIEEITMLYVDKDKLECNTYVQSEKSLQVNDEYWTIKATMQSERNREAIDPFDIIIKKMDDRYWLKSDYFKEEGEYFPVSVYEGDNTFILVHRYSDDVMYIHIYCI